MKRVLLLSVLMLGWASGHAQTAPTASPQALPAWDHLTPAQRDDLIAPLRERWNGDPDERARMLERAHRWKAMPPEQRHRARRGMHRWEGMDAAERAQMQALFERTRSMPKPQRREAMALFKRMLPMPPAERERIKQLWPRMTPEQRKAWLREHAPEHGRHGPRHP